MNFALNVSNKVEDRLLELLSDTLETSDMVDASLEEQLYQQALREVLASDDRIKAAGDIRIGESILIVDSDTRVVGPQLLNLYIDSCLTHPSSRLIACYTEPLRCSLAPKLLLSSIPLGSCKSPKIILKMG